MKLAVRGGTIVTEAGTRGADVLIDAERIAALVEPGEGTSDEEIDARGLLVMPGVVDAHVHFNDPGRTEWEGWARGSRAAAAGGVTTVLDMPLNSLPPVLDGASFAAKRAVAERSSVVDFGLWGGLTGADPGPLRELASCGAVGLKAFLCESGVPEFPKIADRDLVPALRAAAEADLTVALHCEDETVVREATARVRADGRHDARAWSASRPPLAEVRAVARACDAARQTGARIHVVHLSAIDALGAIDAARKVGTVVSVETCPHYFAFDDEDATRIGPALKCAPPLRDAANGRALWSALLGGRIDLIASDHSPCTPELKARGDADIFAAWGGVAGVQSLLPAVFTYARARLGLGSAGIAGLLSWRLATTPAQRFGLWPRKGRIGPAADADIVLFDPQAEWTLDPKDSLTAGVSPYIGRRFTGRVVRTLVRGRTVYRDGEVVADGGAARFVPREGGPS